MHVGYIEIAIGTILISNMVLARFLGLCPFIGVTRRTSDAVGMGFAVMFVMTMATFVTSLLYKYVLINPGPDGFNLLVALGIVKEMPAGGYVLVLKTVSYILVIAVLVQFVEMVLRKSVPVLYKALGIYLPLITTNCAVMGVTLLTTSDWKYQDAPLSLGQTVWMGFCGGVGFTLAMILMSGIRERLAVARVPKALQNVPIAFISTGLMALAFLGFSKLFGIEL
ncbi:MAG: electron transport complex subunit RsxA [Planctomycetes bacterium]|nr:electron transport complex subunit RsxA [Planctomycetota bacterium]